MKWALPCCASAALVALLAAELVAQAPASPSPPPSQPPPQRFVWPDTLTNPQVLPRDVGSQRLRETMIGFVNALGVRCSHCHVDPEGVPLPQRDFASDANPKKNVARAMMRMVGRINGELLPAIDGLSEPRVTCFTCHRGATEPATAPPPAPAPAPARG